MKTFTYEDVLHVATTLPEDGINPGVEENGSGIGCYYLNHDGSPACIAANIFYQLDPAILTGVIEWDAEESEWSPDNWNARARQICEAAKELGIAEFDDRAKEFLDLAQGEADEGMGWGYAVSEALSVADARDIMVESRPLETFGK